MPSLSNTNYAFQNLCLIPVVQTVVAGSCAVGRVLDIALISLPTLAKDFALRDKKNLIGSNVAYKHAYNQSKIRLVNSAKNLGEDVARILPLVGTVAAGKSLKLTAAESLSLIPGVNIVAGTATIVSNLAQIAFNTFALAFRNVEKGLCHTYHCLANLNVVDDHKAYRFNNTIIAVNRAQGLTKKDILRNVDYLGYGLIRFVPGFSTGYYVNEIQRRQAMPTYGTQKYQGIN